VTYLVPNRQTHGQYSKLIRRHRLLNRLASISVCVAPNRHRLDSVNAKGDCRRCKCGDLLECVDEEVPYWRRERCDLLLR
jgi:hypothetical protein